MSTVSIGGNPFQVRPEFQAKVVAAIQNDSTPSTSEIQDLEKIASNGQERALISNLKKYENAQMPPNSFSFDPVTRAASSSVSTGGYATEGGYGVGASISTSTTRITGEEGGSQEINSFGFTGAATFEQNRTTGEQRYSVQGTATWSSGEGSATTEDVNARSSESRALLNSSFRSEPSGTPSQASPFAPKRP
jgi:hypothetical protein